LQVIENRFQAPEASACQGCGFGFLFFGCVQGNPPKFI
jgi:hypothetical protein